MTRRKAKKHSKRPSKKKITGTVIKLTAKQITLLSKGDVWEIDRKSNTKVISGTLKRGSTVTVEFNRHDGVVARDAPGKRTETGTVIGLTASQITLRTATTTWIISRTDDNTKIVVGPLTLGATNVTIEFNVPPGQQVVA